MKRINGYYWCKLLDRWDIFTFCEGFWYDGAENSYKEEEFGEIDESVIVRQDVGIIKALKSSLEKAKKRNWDTLYILVDIHDTVIVSNYSSDKLPDEFYPFAKETL